MKLKVKKTQYLNSIFIKNNYKYTFLSLPTLDTELSSATFHIRRQSPEVASISGFCDCLSGIHMSFVGGYG